MSEQRASGKRRSVPSSPSSSAGRKAPARRRSATEGSTRTSRRKTSQEEALGKYRAKRDFTRTAEPEGAEHHGEAAPIFVVQQHAARRLHYDVRLEAAGVLKSWAVPKGPSADPAVKRLAVRTEDHPIEYAEFEGVIPAGEYGGGEVIVWDTGTYENLTEHQGSPVPVAEAVEHGHVAVWLEGQKLRGGYAFTRLPTSRGGATSRARKDPGGGSWLMVKMRDDAVSGLERSKAMETAASVRSGRTLADVVADPTAAPRRPNRRAAAGRERPRRDPPLR